MLNDSTYYKLWILVLKYNILNQSLIKFSFTTSALVMLNIFVYYFPPQFLSC